MIKVGTRFNVMGNWYDEVKQVLERYENKAIVVYRTDYKDCNFTAVLVEDKDGTIRCPYSQQFDVIHNDDMDNRMLHRFLHS